MLTVHITDILMKENDNKFYISGSEIMEQRICQRNHSDIFV